MSEHEWETPRIPRANSGFSVGSPRRRLGPIDHYIALECPRESVAWVLKGRLTDGEASRRTPSVSKTKSEEGTTAP
jgi:hypothetical protein